MKTLFLITLTLAIPNLALAASYAVTTDAGEWLVNTTWKGAWSSPDNIIPTSADLAIVHQNKTLVHSGGTANARDFYISFHPADHARDFTGVFKISNTATLNVDFRLILSPYGSDGEFIIEGDQTTITADRFQIGHFGETPEADDLTLRFNLGPTGTGTFNVGALDINGQNGSSGNQNTTLIVDAANYTAGSKLITLIDHDYLENANWDNVVYHNFNNLYPLLGISSTSMHLTLWDMNASVPKEITPSGRINFQTDPNFWYLILSSETLEPGSWLPVRSPSLGTGGMDFYNYSVTKEKEFFKIVTMPAN